MEASGRRCRPAPRRERASLAPPLLPHQPQAASRRPPRRPAWGPRSRSKASSPARRTCWSKGASAVRSRCSSTRSPWAATAASRARSAPAPSSSRARCAATSPPPSTCWSAPPARCRRHPRPARRPRPGLPLQGRHRHGAQRQGHPADLPERREGREGREGRRDREAAPREVAVLPSPAASCEGSDHDDSVGCGLLGKQGCLSRPRPRPPGDARRESRR